MSLARKVINECNSIAKAMGVKFNEEFDPDEFFENAQISYTVAYDYLTESSVEAGDYEDVGFVLPNGDKISVRKEGNLLNDGDITYKEDYYDFCYNCQRYGMNYYNPNTGELESNDNDHLGQDGYKYKIKVYDVVLGTGKKFDQKKFVGIVGKDMKLVEMTHVY